MECDRREASGRTDNGELLRCPIDHHFRHANDTPNDHFHGAGEGQHWRGNAGLEHYHRPTAPPGDHQSHPAECLRRNFVLHQPLCERWSATLHLVDYGGTTPPRPPPPPKIEKGGHPPRPPPPPTKTHAYPDPDGYHTRPDP